MNHQTESEQCLAETAEARASFYWFINLHFLDLPDEQFVGSLRDAEFHSVLEALSKSADAHQEIVAGAALMRGYLDATRDCDLRELAKRLGVDRTHLYRSVTPQTDVAPPYEALWTGKGRDTDLLHELARVYREGGFTLKEDVHDRPDYIGIELNFMERLVLKEISARGAGEETTLQSLLKDQRDFLVNHVGRWVPDFVSSALGQAQTDFYRGHLQMLKGFVEQEKEVLGRISVSF